MSVTATTGGSAPYTSQKHVDPSTAKTGEYHTTRRTQEETHGGEPPKDFGHGDPDYNHDGTVTDAESRVYQADRRSADRHYEVEKRSEERRYLADSKERIAHEKELSKNYRAELQARTAQMQSNNDNKMHKLFGKESTPPPDLVRPLGPEKA
jgi:hypothetical protein